MLRPLLSLFTLLAGLNGQDCSFTNPIRGGNAPDPAVVYKDGYYYGCYTTGGDIRVWRNENLERIFQGESASVWNQGNDIWAPEIHYLEGKWYVYSTHNTGSFWMNTFILESNTQDPLGSYTLKAELSQLGNTLDAHPWRDSATGQLYMVYSRLGSPINQGQDIWLTKMSNPYTPEGSPMGLSHPQYGWEKEKGAVNEGPYFLAKGDKIHIVYSASQTHYEGYKLGRVTATLGSDPMNPDSWVKHPEPVFQKSVINGVYAPGHHSTVKTPGGEWWLVYHAKYEHNKNTVHSSRDARMQRFTFDADNNPVFGEPVATGVSLVCPDAAGVAATYDFDDGSLQGWTDLTPANTNSGSRNWAVSPPAFPSFTQVGAGAIGQDVGGGGNQDSPHPTLWLRSPKFLLDPSQDLAVWLSGGTGSGSLDGIAVGALPSNTTNPGFMGVALRNADTERFVLSGSKAYAGNHWEQVIFTSTQLSTLDANATYTLDLIDAAHGGWGWVAMDTVMRPSLNFEYADWVLAHELSGSQTNRIADPDGDGLDNFGEYVFGGNPQNKDADAVVPGFEFSNDDGGGRAFEFSYNRRVDNPELSYQLKKSMDLSLGSWVMIDHPAPSVEVVDDTIENVSYRIPVDSERGFFRLEVSEP